MLPNRDLQMLQLRSHSAPRNYAQHTSSTITHRVQKIDVMQRLHGLKDSIVPVASLEVMKLHQEEEAESYSDPLQILAFAFWVIN